MGARGDDDNGSDSGSVYLYDLANGNAETKITASDGASGDIFGNSVALSGNILAVGAFGDNVNRGSVYLFD